MSAEAITCFLLLSLLAEIVGTLGGFGSSLLFVPIASMFLDFFSVLGITALFHVVSNIAKISLFREHIVWRVVLMVGIPAVLFVIAGAFLSKFLDPELLKVFLSVFLVATSTLLMVFRGFALRPTNANSFIGGSLSGIIAGMLGTGGAVRGLTLTAFNFEKGVFVATSAFIDLGVDISRSFVYSFNGYIHRHDLFLIPALFVISFLGSYIGKLILGKMSQRQFRSLVLVLILIVGILPLLNINLS